MRSPRSDGRRAAPAGLVHHFDRASAYASGDYRGASAAHGVIAGMSRKENRRGNAVAESFIATLRAELVDHERFATCALTEAVIGRYIDDFYNPRRRLLKLHYTSPLEFELQAQVAAFAA